MGGSAVEFPLLSAMGLYAADIRGDGNCLFNALSDQLFGDQNNHAVIRSQVINYMRAHADYYKQFIDVNPGGGTRRNPKRKNTAAYSAPVNYSSPTESEIDRVFETHLQSMAKGGTWGDNMEITAFASAFDVAIKIYQRDFAYMVTGDGDEGRDVLHIAYHAWEHYSSIRNLDGPHTGLPNVNIKALSVEEEEQQKIKLAEGPHIQAWQVDALAKSLPFLADGPAVKRALKAAKGDMDRAWEDLNSSQGYSSASSHQGSSSVEREPDSDDDTHKGPNKKRATKSSRPIKPLKAKTSAYQHALAQSAIRETTPEDFTTGWDSDESSTTHETYTRKKATDVVVSNLTSPCDSDGPNDKAATTTKKNPPRFRLLPPKPPQGSRTAVPDSKDAKSSTKPAQREPGPLNRISARDRKDIKKQAQKAARKERQQASQSGNTDDTTNSCDPPVVENAAQAGLALRATGLTRTPPVETTLRTLHI